MDRKWLDHQSSAMHVRDYQFDLPEECIAQTPAEPRDAARLFVHRISEGASDHRTVADLPTWLRKGDLLVVNDTRVRAARLFATRPSGGQVELLLVEALSERRWRAMVKPARKLKPTEPLALEGGWTATPVERDEEDGALWTLDFDGPDSGGGEDLEAFLEAAGKMPLPPYIRRGRTDDRDELDRSRYQTVFARETGAVAAPTAGLHFTPALFDTLDQLGVQRASVTLHVGLGTFQPVTVEDIRDHRMHEERYELTQETVDAIEACRARGGRVIAVGTTSVRTLESCVSDEGVLRAGSGTTRLFLKPPDQLKVVDGLLTNFHLPGSTLLMLVSTLCGRETLLELYQEAIESQYRFYSYGDAMLLLP